MKNKTNILICVSGLTPQIVTETLFCLAVKEKIRIDEIYVLTTKRGRDVILGHDKKKQTPSTALKTEIDNLCKKYKIHIPVFENNDSHIITAKEESVELPDIRSDKDNILFPNKIAEFLRSKTTNPDNRIFCSITGGRKSMSVHIATALSLFAREGDRLLHVLTSEENEFKGFYPSSKKEIDALELSDIPFVRLRSLLSQKIKGKKLINFNYDKIVSYTQKQLKKAASNDKMQLITETKEIKFKDSTIHLEPLEYGIYYYFVETKLEGRSKISIQEVSSKETALRILEFIKQYYPYYDSNIRTKKPWWKTGFDAPDFRSKRSKINKKISKLINDPDLAEEFIILSSGPYANTSYGIKANKNKFRISLPFLP